jgi:nitronate monooxygenase
MAGASGGALASAVTLGGGYGFLAAGYNGLEKFEEQLSIAKSSVGLHPSGYLPVGVGFLCWKLEEPNSPHVELLQAALNARVQSVWFSFGAELERWIKFVRDHDSKTKSATEPKTLIFIMVSSVDEALIAAQEWKVDVLIAQGIESGGHGHSLAPPLLSLVPSIIAAIPNNRPPLLAAGGLVSGDHVASLLTLGADGVVLGTRFLLTPESLYTDAQKQALIAAKETSTVRTRAFDVARGTLGWPTDVDGRALRNNTVEDYEKGCDVEELKRRVGEPDRILVWAGTGVALMSEIKPAKEIVEELSQAAVDHLRAASTLL